MNANNSKIPEVCPNCGSALQEREGKYGKFLGCTKFPECRYIFDLTPPTGIKCPDCGKELKWKGGKMGRFLGCSGYPDCTFLYNPSRKDNKDIFCPDCGEKLELKSDSKGTFLTCTGKESCSFKLEVKLEKTIKCPECGEGNLRKRTGKYGPFLGCDNYPECRFAFNPDMGSQVQLKCPDCGYPLDVKEGKFGKFLGCTGFPDCKFILNLS